jgi:hypothetical protein
VLVALALTGAVLFIPTGLALTARLVRIGNLDAVALAVVPQPGQPSVLLLLVGWPRHHGQEATLLVRLDDADQRSLTMLSRWCEERSSISPRRCQRAELELRRRQSLDRVRVQPLAEDAASGRPAPAR